MIYQIYEWQRQLNAPMENMAKHYASWLRHPLNPLSYMPASQATVTFIDRYVNASAQYHRPDFVFAPATLQGVPVEVESATIDETPFCLYRRFRYVNQKREAVLGECRKVALISPISGNYAVVFNEVVSCLLPDAEVWVTDWRDARDVSLAAGRFGLDENVAHLIDFMKKHQPEHLICFSQSCNPTLIALALLTQAGHAPLPKTLTLIGGPMDTRVNSGALGAVATKQTPAWIEDNLIMEVPAGHIGTGRKVFPGFLQHAGFMGLHWDRQVKNQLEHIVSAASGDEKRRKQMDRSAELLSSVMDIPAEHYLDNLQHFFLEHSLPQGTLQCLGTTVDLAAIRDTAVLVVEGERDTLCPPGQTREVFQHLTQLPKKQQKALLVKDCGHFGLVGGHNFKQFIFPVVHDWLATHSTT